jgi:putative ABC transport system permease protein
VQAFVARAAEDVIEIVGFMRWLGWGCLAAVLALVGNAIMLSVQDRIREHAVFQTLGFSGPQIARLIVAEGLTLSVAGTVVGCVAALTFLSYSALALTVESHSVPILASPSIFVWGVIIAAAVGGLAGLVPAWQASRREIVSCFRAA